jgi:hypothetical protein
MQYNSSSATRRPVHMGPKPTAHRSKCAPPQNQRTHSIEVVATSRPTKAAPLRILKFGARTGVTTSGVLPALARLNMPVIHNFTVSVEFEVWMKSTRSRY